MLRNNLDFKNFPSTCKPAPFSSDEDAIFEREFTDYTYKITYQMARSDSSKRRVRVYADGIYDLFHQGHAHQLMKAKNIFPNVYLIVGVCSDKLTQQMNGRTVMNEVERYEILRHCRYVDEIVKNAPWMLSDDFIESNKIDFVAHNGIPYAGNGIDDIYGPLKAKGMFVAIERTEDVSTSDIVARIVKDYDLYVRRKLARAYSAKELNVPILSEKKFRIQNEMDEVKDRGRRELTMEKGDIITKWEEKSREFIDAFVLLFGVERLNHLWNESKGKMIQALRTPNSLNCDSDVYDEEAEDTPVIADYIAEDGDDESEYYIVEDDEDDCIARCLREHNECTVKEVDFIDADDSYTDEEIGYSGQSASYIAEDVGCITENDDSIAEDISNDGCTRERNECIAEDDECITDEDDDYIDIDIDYNEGFECIIEEDEFIDSDDAYTGQNGGSTGNRNKEDEDCTTEEKDDYTTEEDDCITEENDDCIAECDDYTTEEDDCITVENDDCIAEYDDYTTEEDDRIIEENEYDDYTTEEDDCIAEENDVCIAEEDDYGKCSN